ncbi:syntaxin-17 [Thrips palmi]|uniref:Syntaxin-17 n=1 Tax=Thrips palmi TaxID=161013 RepID=A0A6P8XZZ6_THRPL|nr:syntaxin-17 [Thrips palmi]
MEQQSPTSKKRPLKHFDHSIVQFNDVVIPHRLDMMKKHRCNIEKAILSHDYQSAIREQAAAKMLVQNLKRDLSEIESLRNQVDVHDLLQFDKAIESSRKIALAALEEYIDLGNKLSPSKKLKTCTSDNENVAEFDFGTAPRLQLMADKQSILDKDEEEYVRSWELLQNDIECLHTIYADLHELTMAQGELVDNIEDNVAHATESVHQGNLNLKRALMYKGAAYPLIGAAIGTLAGGPVGFFIGLKAGGCAAVGGGLLGFVGGKFLKKTHKPVDEETRQKGEDTSSLKPHQS